MSHTLAVYSTCRHLPRLASGVYLSAGPQDFPFRCFRTANQPTSTVLDGATTGLVRPIGCGSVRRLTPHCSKGYPLIILAPCRSFLRFHWFLKNSSGHFDSLEATYIKYPVPGLISCSPLPAITPNVSAGHPTTYLEHDLRDALTNRVVTESKTPRSHHLFEATPEGSPPKCPSDPSPAQACRQQAINPRLRTSKSVRNTPNACCFFPILTEVVNRVTIVERIPSDVLLMIASELEELPSDGQSITASKHQKNQRLVLMKNVCKTWKIYLLQSKLLWGDICFNTTRRSTIEMAGSFLDLLEKTTFNVYAASSPGDLIGGSDVQVMARDLLLRLGQRVKDIKHCGIHTPSEEFCAYLDLPVSKLWYLNIEDAHLPGVLLGDLSALRGACIPTSTSWPWTNSTFPDLTTLSLHNQRASSIPLSQILRLLRGAPKLTALTLTGFAHFDPDREDEVAVELPLEVLTLTGCDACAILPHLVIPYVRDCNIHGEINMDDEPSSMYGFLSGPPAKTTTVPNQPRTPSLRISVYNRIKFFSMDLVGGDHRFRLGLDWGPEPNNWQRWMEQLLTAVSTRFKPMTEIRLDFFFTGPIPPTLYSPLLQIQRVAHMSIHCSGGGAVTVDILRSLMAVNEDSTLAALPALRGLTVSGVLSFKPDEIDVIRAYMDFRATRRLPFTFWAHDCDVSWTRGFLSSLGIISPILGLSGCSSYQPRSSIPGVDPPYQCSAVSRS